MKDSTTSIGMRSAYGVFVFDQGEWRQFSQHGSLSAARERALEAWELLGLPTRVSCRTGQILHDMGAASRTKFRLQPTIRIFRDSEKTSQEQGSPGI
jgi:hypothetical protein